MAQINAGVTAMVKYVSAGAEAFSEYITYMDREEARHEHFTDFNLFNKYMGNPEKSTGLFTKNALTVSKEEAKNLKHTFRAAQENNSLLWQVVISFDNAWLAENHVYNAKEKVLDEKKMKEVSVKALNKMLHNEGLDNAVWTASIHYNTDNIHVHAGIVEPVPMREKKVYAQYNYVKNSKNRLVKESPILDQHGNQIYKEEYKGKFKQESIRLCKQQIAGEISLDKELNAKINSIIRDVIVRDIKNQSIIRDEQFKERFLTIYSKLPDCSKNLWNYNNNIMLPLRKEIDALSKSYIEKYKKDEFAELKKSLQEQQLRYRIAYGKSESDYMGNKLQELYTRMGNTILKEMRTLNIDIVGKSMNVDSTESYNDESHNPNIGEYEIILDEGIEQNDKPFSQGLGSYDSDKIEDNHETHLYYSWDENYKYAKSKLYTDNEKEPPDLQLAFYLLSEEASKGNVLAMYDLGEMYLYGKGINVDIDKSQQFFEKSLHGFETLVQTCEEKEKSYLSYRIGKHYLMGYGTEQNYERAFEHIKKAAKAEKPTVPAVYTLGNMYFHGQGVEQDYKEAEQLYKLAAIKGNPYAAYSLATMYEKSIGGVTGQHFPYYKEAFEGFKELEKNNKDDKLQYRLGMMLHTGKGCILDKEEGNKYLEKASLANNLYAKYYLAKQVFEQGEKADLEKMKWAIEEMEVLAKEELDLAQYALGKIYLSKNPEIQNLEKAVFYLERASLQNNDYAQYALGKEYFRGDILKKDIKKGVEYLEQSAEQGNQYAQYMLGKEYLTGEAYIQNITKGIEYLEKSAEQGNQYAQYTLGKAYLDGELISRDVTKALFYMGGAAEQGNQYAQYTLGKMYMYGNGVAKDLQLSTRFLAQAAGQGNVFAMVALDKSLKGKTIQLQDTAKPGQTIVKMNQAMIMLRKGLNNDIESYKNQREHEELSWKIDMEKR